MIDEPVPQGYQLAQPEPELLAAAGLKVGQLHTLLLDPREVAQIKDSVAVAIGEYQQLSIASPPSSAKTSSARVLGVF